MVQTGVNRETISKGCKELESRTIEGIETSVPNGNIRDCLKAAKSYFKDPALLSDLENLIEPTTRGDPESAPLHWTSKSTRKLAEELKKMGDKVTHARVADMLHVLGYSLPGNIGRQ